MRSLCIKGREVIVVIKSEQKTFGIDIEISFNSIQFDKYRLPPIGNFPF